MNTESHQSQDAKYPHELETLSESQHELVLKQFECCRQEILARLQSIDQVIVFALGTTGVIWSWILTNQTGMHRMLLGLPFAVVLLCWLRVEALVTSLLSVSEFLRTLTAAFGVKLWEDYATENRIGRHLDRWTRFACFIPLLIANAGLALVVWFGGG